MIIDYDEARASLSALLSQSGGSRIGKTVLVPCAGCADPIRASFHRGENSSPENDWVGITFRGEPEAWHRVCAAREFMCVYCEEAPSKSGTSISFQPEHDAETESLVVCWGCRGTAVNLINKAGGHVTHTMGLWEPNTIADNIGLIYRAVHR